MPRHFSALFSTVLFAAVTGELVPALRADQPFPPPGHARPPVHVKVGRDLQPLVTTSPTGLSPSAVRKFYGFDQITGIGSGQIIGIVTAYDDPNIEADFGV